MGIFSSIVAPTDLGDGSAAAVRVAASLAHDSGASLCVMHVYAVPEHMFAVYPMLASFAPSLPLQQAADAALRDWTTRLGLEVDVDSHRARRRGDRDRPRRGAEAQRGSRRDRDARPPPAVADHRQHGAEDHPRVPRPRPHGAPRDRRPRARPPSEHTLIVSRAGGVS